MDYVVIAPELLYQLADMFRVIIGSFFSYGIYISIILLALDVFLNFLHNITD